MTATRCVWKLQTVFKLMLMFFNLFFSCQCSFKLDLFLYANPLSCASSRHLSTNQSNCSTAFILLFSSPPASLEYLRNSGHKVCVTPAGVLRQTLCDGESPLKGQTQLEVSFCRKQQLNGVWRGPIQTALIMLWEVYISADDSPLSWAKRPERRAEGGRGGYYNDFLKSLCRGYKLFSLSHFSHLCVTHSLCFARFHATPGCVWECGGVSGEGWWMGLRGEVQRGFQHSVELSHDSPVAVSPGMT